MVSVSLVMVSVSSYHGLCQLISWSLSAHIMVSVSSYHGFCQLISLATFRLVFRLHFRLLASHMVRAFKKNKGCACINWASTNLRIVCDLRL
jgi:hypothetical protein